MVWDNPKLHSLHLCRVYLRTIEISFRSMESDWNTIYIPDKVLHFVVVTHCPIQVYLGYCIYVYLSFSCIVVVHCREFNWNDPTNKMTLLLLLLCVVCVLAPSPVINTSWLIPNRV